MADLASMAQFQGMKTTRSNASRKHLKVSSQSRPELFAGVALVLVFSLVSLVGRGPILGLFFLPLYLVPNPRRLSIKFPVLVSILILISAFLLHYRDGATLLSVDLQCLVLAVVYPFIFLLRELIERSTQSAFQQEAASLDEISQADKQKISVILSGLSAELREPLSVVFGWVDLLLDSDLKRESRNRLEIIKSRTGVISSVLDDIQDFSSLQKGLLKITPAPIDLKDTLTKTLSDFEASMRTDVDLSTDFQLGANEFGVVDARRLSQCVKYLVATASRLALPDDELMITISVSSPDGDSPVKQGKLQLLVRNASTDIKPEVIDALFDPISTKQIHALLPFGTRIAMALTKGIIELMEGEVVVGSLPKRGALFLMTLPLQVVDLDEFRRLREASKTRNRSLQSTENLKVLIVDDNNLNRNITKKLITTLGHSAITANDGVDSVDLCEKGHFDLILMDLAMPRMDGYQAAKAIRQGPNSSAIIVALTASTESETLPRCQEAGMDGCISKPVSRNLLQATIAAYAGSGAGRLNLGRPSLRL